MKKPNFFIVGAPKCGTTSLATWLSDHQDIYMSPVKEPHYFNTDDKHNCIRSLARYERLFHNARRHHVAIGEASVWYLYSRDATNNILNYNPNAKFIVCLRNPLEMAPSLHLQQLHSRAEAISDFEEAWSLRKARQHGFALGPACIEPKHLDYASACALGTQLQRLYNAVPSNRILPIVLDDMKLDPRKEYLKVLDFLGVNDDLRFRFPLVNPAKLPRSFFLQSIIRRSARIKLYLGINKSFGIAKMNSRTVKRGQISDALFDDMRGIFAPEIAKLETLLDRDFQFWLDLKDSKKLP